MDYTKEIGKAAKHPNVVEFMSQNGGSLASSDTQVKKGTLVLEFKDGYQWLAYANGYLRETNNGAGGDLKIISKPKEGYDYESMGLDFYTDYAIKQFQKRIDKRIRLGKERLNKMLNGDLALDLFVYILSGHKQFEDGGRYDGVLSNPGFQYLGVSELYSRLNNLNMREILNRGEDYAGNKLVTKKSASVLSKVLNNINIDGSHRRLVIKTILP